MAFDRLIYGVQAAASPAVCVAATPAIRPAFRRGLAQPPGLSLCSSPLVPSGSYRQDRPQPIADPAERGARSLQSPQGTLPWAFYASWRPTPSTLYCTASLRAGVRWSRDQGTPLDANGLGNDLPTCCPSHGPSNRHLPGDCVDPVPSRAVRERRFTGPGQWSGWELPSDRPANYQRHRPGGRDADGGHV